MKRRSISEVPFSFKTEVLAGITTFLTMVYIAFVNPTILHDAGMDQGAVFTATCLVTAFACALTGILAKTPIGVAPGMALNIYFSYSVVQGLGISWQHALAMVFVSGVLFFIASVIGEIVPVSVFSLVFFVGVVTIFFATFLLLSSDFTSFKDAFLY